MSRQLLIIGAVSLALANPAPAPQGIDLTLVSGTTSSSFSTANDNLASPPGYGIPLSLNNAAINAPYDQFGANSYLGATIFKTGSFNISACAQACSAKSIYNLAHPSKDGTPVQTCQFFNTYVLYINTTNNLQGQYCALYSESWPASYATNVGQYRGNDHFLIEDSYAFSNSTNPGSPCASCAVAAASKTIVSSSLQTFCSSLLGYTTPLSTTFTGPTTTPTVTETLTFVTSTSAAVSKRGTKPTDTAYNVLTHYPPLAPTANVQKLAVAVSAPAPLTRFPPTIVSSACSLDASSVAITSTITQLSTVTAPAVTITVSTTIPAPPVVTPGQKFYIEINNSGTAADGQLIRGDEYGEVFLGAGSTFALFDLVEFVVDPTTSILQVADGSSLVSLFDDPQSYIYVVYSNDGPHLSCSILPPLNELKCTAGFNVTLHNFTVQRYYATQFPVVEMDNVGQARLNAIAIQ